MGSLAIGPTPIVWATPGVAFRLPLLVVAILVLFTGIEAARAAPLPVLGTWGFRGPGARRVASELTVALRRAGGLGVVSRTWMARQLQRLEPVSRGWTRRADAVRRILPRLGLDLLLTGRVAREGGRTVIIAMIRAAHTGRVVAAVRVALDARWRLRRSKVVRRLRDYALRALPTPRRSPPRRVVRRPAPPPLPAPRPPRPRLAGLPPVALPATRPVALPEPPDEPSYRRFWELDGGVGYVRVARPGNVTNALLARVQVTAFPVMHLTAGWPADLFVQLGVEASLAGFDDVTGAYFRVRPGVGYRWELGPHQIRAALGYDFRYLGTSATGPDAQQFHLLALEMVAELRLGETMTVRPFARLWPAGGTRGASDFRIGAGGGLEVVIEAGSVAAGMRYQGEYFLRSGTGLTGIDSGDTVHAFSAFVGYRY